MGAVRPGEVVEALPFPQPGREVDVTLVAETLIEPLLLGPVGTFDLAVQLGRARLDVGMVDTEILDMPVELRLELMAIIHCPAVDFAEIDERGSDLADAEREGRDHVVDEVDGVCLGVAFVDLEGSDPGHIVDRRILEAAKLLAAFSFEGQELDIHLDVMARHPLVVALGVDSPMRVPRGNRLSPFRQRTRYWPASEIEIP